MLFVAITFIPFIDHQRRSCLSPRCSNLEPAMEVPVTLDNTIGAAFLGVAVSCMWVNPQWLIQAPRYIIIPNQPFRNCNRSNIFILLQLSQRLDAPKGLSECRCKFSWKKLLILIRGWGPHVDTVSRLSIVMRFYNLRIFTGPLRFCIWYSQSTPCITTSSWTLETQQALKPSSGRCIQQAMPYTSRSYSTGASRWSILNVTRLPRSYMLNGSPAAGPLQCKFLANPDRHSILTLAVF